MHWLTEELVALGHDVTLYASGNTITSARLEASWPRALRLDGSVRDPERAPYADARTRAAAKRRRIYDFLHFHLDYYPFSLFAPSVDAICYDPFTATLICRNTSRFSTTFSSAPVISISNSQRRPLPQANWVQTIHRGLRRKYADTATGPSQSYFAFLGRIAPEKGIERAIHIAKHCGIPLKIAAKVDPADSKYFEEL